MFWTSDKLWPSVWGLLLHLFQRRAVVVMEGGGYALKALEQKKAPFSSSSYTCRCPERAAQIKTAAAAVGLYSAGGVGWAFFRNNIIENFSAVEAGGGGGQPAASELQQPKQEVE